MSKRNRNRNRNILEEAETAQAETAQAETAQAETAQAETAQAETAQAEPTEPADRPMSWADALPSAPAPRTGGRTGRTGARAGAAATIMADLAALGRPVPLGAAVAAWLATPQGAAWREAQAARRAAKGLPPAATPAATLEAGILPLLAGAGWAKVGRGWIGPAGSARPEGVAPPAGKFAG